MENQTVRIVTDSNAYLRPEIIEQYQIEIIPHRVKVGSAFYEEDEDFSADDLFRKLHTAQQEGIGQLPELAPADINTILDCYQNLGDETEEIISIHMSSELSGMWDQARKAADMLKGRYTIRVIDSLCSSYGLGLLVEEAAKAAAEGNGVHDIARLLNGTIPHMYISVFAESLNYLERCSKLSASQSLLGTMLGIKAMLMMEEGVLVPLEKVQTREDVVEKLYEFVVEFARVERVGIFQHNYEMEQATLMVRLEEALPEIEVEALTYAPSLAAYIGPNVIGVVVYEGTYSYFY